MMRKNQIEMEQQGTEQGFDIAIWDKGISISL
jgi:hypothetical protein